MGTGRLTENGFLAMPESKQLQQIVERAVAQVLDRQLPKLQSELVERVLAELPALEPGAGSTAGSQTPAGLAQSVSSIHTGNTQKEILRSLLDAAGAYAARVALFVVKAGAATGWQGRGLGGDDAIKDFPLDISSGPVAHALQKRVVTPANIAEMDRRFVKQFGGPENEQILVLPLVLKENVAALLYADGGDNGALGAASLESLVMATSTWLEVVSLRKQTQKEVMESAAGVERAPAPVPVQTVSSFPDPFAAHTPKHTAAKPAPEPEPAAEVVGGAASCAS